MNPTGVLYTARVPDKRNRLTVFFRIIMAIPLAVVGIIYAIGSAFAVIGAWFAIVFTGRYPEGLYSFVTGVMQFSARCNAYVYLQVDQYPSFSLGNEEGYPVQLQVPPAKEQYSRAKTFFRIIIAIPVMIIAYAFAIVARVMAVVVWIVTLFVGRTGEGLHSALNLGISYTSRVGAYLGLLTEDWPSITDAEGGGFTMDGGDGPAAASPFPPPPPPAPDAPPPPPPPAPPAPDPFGGS